MKKKVLLISLVAVLFFAAMTGIIVSMVSGNGFPDLPTWGSSKDSGELTVKIDNGSSVDCVEGRSMTLTATTNVVPDDYSWKSDSELLTIVTNEDGSAVVTAGYVEKETKVNVTYRAAYGSEIQSATIEVNIKLFDDPNFATTYTVAENEYAASVTLSSASYGFKKNVELSVKPVAGYALSMIRVNGKTLKFSNGDITFSNGEFKASFINYCQETESQIELVFSKISVMYVYDETVVDVALPGDQYSMGKSYSFSATVKKEYSAKKSLQVFVNGEHVKANANGKYEFVVSTIFTKVQIKAVDPIELVFEVTRNTDPAGTSQAKTITPNLSEAVIIAKMTYEKAKTDADYQFGVRLYNGTTFLSRIDLQLKNGEMILFPSSDATSVYTYTNADAVKSALAGKGLTIVIIRHGTEYYAFTDNGNGQYEFAFEVTMKGEDPYTQIGFGMQKTIDTGDKVTCKMTYLDGATDWNGLMSKVSDVKTKKFSVEVIRDADEKGTSKTLQMASNSADVVMIANMQYAKAKTDENYQFGVRLYDKKVFSSRIDLRLKDGVMTLFPSYASSQSYTYKNVDAVKETLAGNGLSIAMIRKGTEYYVFTDNGSGTYEFAFEVTLKGAEAYTQIGFGLQPTVDTGDSVTFTMTYMDGATDWNNLMALVPKVDESTTASTKELLFEVTRNEDAAGTSIVKGMKAEDTNAVIITKMKYEKALTDEDYQFGVRLYEENKFISRFDLRLKNGVMTLFPSYDATKSYVYQNEDAVKSALAGDGLTIVIVRRGAEYAVFTDNGSGEYEFAFAVQLQSEKAYTQIGFGVQTSVDTGDTVVCEISYMDGETDWNELMSMVYDKVYYSKYAFDIIGTGAAASTYQEFATELSTGAVMINQLKYEKAETDTDYQFGMRIYEDTTFRSRIDLCLTDGVMTLFPSSDTSKTYVYKNTDAVKAALAGNGLAIAVVREGTNYVVWTDDGYGTLVKAFEVTIKGEAAYTRIGFGVQKNIEEGNKVSGPIYYFDGMTDVKTAIDELGWELSIFEKMEYTELQFSIEGTGSNPSAYKMVTSSSSNGVIISNIKYAKAITDTDYQFGVRLYDQDNWIERIDLQLKDGVITLFPSKDTAKTYTYSNADAIKASLANDGLVIAIVRNGKDYIVWTDNGYGTMVKAFDVTISGENPCKRIGFGVQATIASGDVVTGDCYYFDGTLNFSTALETLQLDDKVLTAARRQKLSLKVTGKDSAASTTSNVTSASTQAVLISKTKYEKAVTDTDFQFGIRLYEDTFRSRIDICLKDDVLTIFPSNDTSKAYTYQNADAVKAALAGDGLTVVIVRDKKAYTVWTDDGSGTLVKAFDVTINTVNAYKKIGYGVQSTIATGDIVTCDIYYFDGITNMWKALAYAR